MTARRPYSAGDEVDLAALHDALQVVTASPQFVARVRARLGRERMSGAGVRWPKLSFGAAVALTVIAVVAIWRGPTAKPGPSVAGRTTPARTVASEQARKPADRSIPFRSSEGVRPVPTPLRAAHLVIGRRSVREPRPEALVPDDERRALDRFLIALRQGRATVPPVLRLLEDENGCLIAPPPVEIPLMKPIEPLSVTPADRLRSEDK